jgi:hypothetical protein
MPNPFFALALGLCTSEFYQDKCGQAPLRSILRNSIARAHAVVVLDRNQKRTDREGAIAKRIAPSIKDGGIRFAIPPYALLDIVDRNWESRRVTELPPSEWAMLRIVTDSP